MENHDFLGNLNESLSHLEPEYPELQSKPHIWLLGLPRSGTTLTMQLLSKHLEVGYVNNIMARFWKAPCIGAKLSQIILGENRSQLYSSDYGSTQDPSGPHEFSYFWHHVFGVENYQRVNLSRIAQEVDWQKIRSVLNNIASEMPSPMAYKAMWPGYFLPQFSKMFPNSLYIVLQRPSIEIAMSLTRAREKYYGNRQAWWSMTFDGYEEYLDLPYCDQIAIQLRELSQIYFEPVSDLPEEQVLYVSYENLCRAPSEFLKSVCGRLNKVMNADLSIMGAPPAQFDYRNTDGVDEKTKRELENSLERLFPDYLRN